MDVEIQRPREVGSCRVVKVDKEAAWELFTTQAANEGRTVRPLPGLFIHLCFLRLLLLLPPTLCRPTLGPISC